MNPFDDPDGTFLVVVNDQNQHALWPAFAPVPDGWHEAYPAAPRDVCLDHIERTWTDLAPGGTARHADPATG
ncbi:MbtH family protein [Streptomyces malaysiensis]|uniref:MbtH family protein n=1 Tax=Streptomyces malaysiensis TaxID=92644 RepID=UPI00321FFA44|nr:MbtH family protein [Streptomyces malaysiensis]